MPRDSAGNYSLVSGYLATTGQTILASHHNPPLEDIRDALTGSLPRNGSGAMQADLSMGSHKITGLSDGTEDTDAVTYSQLTAATAFTSEIRMFARNTAPTGWLICDGSAVSRTAYAALFALIGTTFGVGDGSTTFNVPNFNGRFARGWNDGSSGDPDDGRVFGSTQTDALASHTHTFTTDSSGNHSHSYDDNGTRTPVGVANVENGTIFEASDLSRTTGIAGAHTHTGTTDATGSTETRPDNLAVLFCIKT